MYLKDLDLRTWPDIDKMSPDTFFKDLSVQLVYHTASELSHESLCKEWNKYNEVIVYEAALKHLLDDHRQIGQNNQIVYDLLKRWKGENSEYFRDVALPDPTNPYNVLLVGAHRWWAEAEGKKAFDAGSDFFAKIKKEFSVSFREALLKRYRELSGGEDTWMEMLPLGREIFARVYEAMQKEDGNLTPEEFVKYLKDPWSKAAKAVHAYATEKFAVDDNQHYQFAAKWMAGFLVRFWEKGVDNCPVMLSFAYDRFYDGEGDRFSSYEQFIWNSIEFHRAARNMVPLMSFYIRACFNMGFYTVDEVKNHDQIEDVIEKTIAGI